MTYIESRSWNSSVDIVAVYWLTDGRFAGGVLVRSRSSHLHVFRKFLGPPNRWILKAHSSELKRPGRETDYSPPSIAQVKNTSLAVSLSLSMYIYIYIYI
jgi:hypothetical protein